MTEAKREHREAACLARYPQSGAPAEGSWAREWIEGRFTGFGGDEVCLNAIAQALAEAEQRGAEREREAFTELLAAADAMINGFVVPGQSREQTERQLMARLTAARSKLPYFCAKAESSQHLKGEE